MTANDLVAVKALADRIHVDHPEDMHVFAGRLRLHPAGCWVLAHPGATESSQRPDSTFWDGSDAPSRESASSHSENRVRFPRRGPFGSARRARVRQAAARDGRIRPGPGAECEPAVADSGLAGYVLSHPWLSEEPPPLNASLDAVPAGATTYYIHDLALASAARGRGQGAAIVERLAAHAAASGFRSLTLVAVNRSCGFWKRLGFRAAMTAALDEKLASYGSDALLMRRDLTARRD
jgi:GNAT superfamily N-acetyltransferase